MVTELLLVSWIAGPPTGTAVEAPAEAPLETPEATPVETQVDVDAIVDAAAQAAKDRAYLERNHREIEEYVRHLDALAEVDAQLDGCGRAIQAELRMSLALAYLKAEGTCSEDDEQQPEADSTADPPLPDLECSELAARACADRLLESVAEFASTGPSGTDAPFAQAFGCPHAVAEMSVEQMFGSCMVDEYAAAVDRWSGGRGQPEAPTERGEVWPVPRWAGILGVSGGAALLISGAVLLGIDGRCPGGNDPADVAACPSVYETTVPGGVLVGIGAVAVISMGTVLTVTELQRKRRGETRPTAFRRGLDRAQAVTGLRLSAHRPSLILRP